MCYTVNKKLWHCAFQGFDVVVLGSNNQNFIPNVKTSDFLGVASIEGFLDHKPLKLRALAATWLHSW
jgi:hypothetical protein